MKKQRERKLTPIALLALALSCIAIFCVTHLKKMHTDANATPAILSGYATDKTYGAIKNKIDYIVGNISIAEIDTLANQFKRVGYFHDDKMQKEIMVKKTDSLYEISLFVSNIVKTDTSRFFQSFRKIKTMFEPLLPGHKIVFLLVLANDHGHVYKRIE
jgi:hypothetical protein